MKTKIVHIQIVMFVFILIGCGIDETNDDTINRLVTKVNSLENRVDYFEEKININGKEKYIKVNADEMNLRIKPTQTSPICAIVKQGAYLRVLTEMNNKKWLFVEFMIGGFPYSAYISNNGKNVKQEFYDPISFSKVQTRGLIRLLWEEEIVKEIKGNAYQVVGVYISSELSSNKSSIKSHFVNFLRKESIYIKTIKKFDENTISTLCKNNSVNAIISIEVRKDSNSLMNMIIQVFDQNEVILYSVSLPLEAINFNS